MIFFLIVSVSVILIVFVIAKYLNCRWFEKECSQGELSFEMLSRSGIVSVKEKFIINELAIAEKTDGKRYCKKSLLARALISTVFSVVLFFVLRTYYYRSELLIALCVIFSLLFLSIFVFSPVRMLLRAARKDKNEAVADIIERETVTAESVKKYTAAFIMGIGCIIVGIALFLSLSMKPEFKTIEYQGDRVIIKYEPGIVSDEKVIIPEKIDGAYVTRIHGNAFKNCTAVESIVLPDSVEIIEAQAFRGCNNLKEVVLGKNLNTISSGAFKDCKKLAYITLPDSLEFLEGESFMNCTSLTRIIIPEKVTEIRGSTFEGCKKLKEVILHDGIIDIHARAFCECRNLGTIKLPSGITEIHANTFEFCSSLDHIMIPVGVTRIAAHSFYGCSALSDIYIPDTVKEIGSSAFRLCKSLYEIYLPDNVSVNERAFKESPTKLYKKDMSDEEYFGVMEEIALLEFEIIYVVCDKEKGLSEFICPRNGNEIIISGTMELEEFLDEGTVLIAVEGDKEILDYLKKARKAGIESVELCFKSEVTDSVQSFVNDIDELIAINEEVEE